MARIEPVDPNGASPTQRASLAAIVGRVTNMKRTLAHSRVALDALMQWYPLQEAVMPFLGARATSLFCRAISAQNSCLICSSYFRRELVESGEDPDNLHLSELERVVVDFGYQLARDPHAVDDDLYTGLATHFSDEQIVTLTAFGALMIATNVFNDALRVDLDADLEPFRAEPSEVRIG